MEIKTTTVYCQLTRAQGKRIISFFSDGLFYFEDYREANKNARVELNLREAQKIVLGGINLTKNQHLGFSVLDAKGARLTIARGPKSLIIKIRVVKSSTHIEIAERVSKAWLQTVYKFLNNCLARRRAS